MSALTQRSALRLQLAQLDATECGSCSHPLSEHLPSMNGEQKYACKHKDFIPHPKGYKAGNGKFKPCKCKSFGQVLGEQLPGITK